MAAVEFALIAPTLIVLVMGVLEMSFRFRAKEEVTRYVHQVCDLVSRERELTTDEIQAVYDAAIFLMTPLENTSELDIDVSSIGYDDDAEPEMLWRRYAGSEVGLSLSDALELGAAGESVIRVGVRYRYESPITNILGGTAMTLVVEAFARPRLVRVIPLDGQTELNGGNAMVLGT